MGRQKRNHKQPQNYEFEFIGGRQPVLEALRGSQISLQKVYLQEGARGQVIEEIKQVADSQNIPLKAVGKEELEQKAEGQGHQGVVALVQPYRCLDMPRMLATIKPEEHAGGYPFLLMLDHIQDPHNLGSLLRSAACFGVGGIIIPRDRACGVTPAVFKASAGALAHMPVAQAVNLTREAAQLKKQGYWIIGAEMESSTPFDQVDFNLPLVLVLGGEGQGLSRLLREKCDLLVNIPMGGPVSSLNVSVAGGIIMSRVFRQRCEKT